MSHSSVSAAKPLYMLAAEDLIGNEGQWRVYESKRNCAILAGPGSGKTKTLTIKMARILAEDVKPPRRIACITYSNQCVRELRRRLGVLGVEDGRRASICTLHSFCLQHIVLPYAKLAGMPLPDPVVVATNTDKEKCWTSAVSAVISVDENPRNWIFRCGEYQRTHLDRDKPEWLGDDEVTAKIIEAYEKALYSKGLVDFDTMVYMGLHLAEKHDWVRRALRARFPVILVDEYQDLGRALHRLVLTLCRQASIRLIVVGDPDQSIYGFAGAEPTLLQELAACDEFEPVTLKLNYRCGLTIIQASEVSLGESRGFQSGIDESGTIDIHHRPHGVVEQAAFICDQVIPSALKRRDGRQLGDVAVLYRTQYDGNHIADAVEERKWDYIRIDQGNPYTRTPVVLWLEDCAAWCAEGWRCGTPSLSELILRWLAFNESETSDSGRRQLQGELVKFLYSHRTADQSLRDWLSGFRVNCLDRSLSREPRLRDDVLAITKLAEVCKPNARLAGFTVSAFGGQGSSGAHLNLLTIHSAKGMEFDVVIIMALEEGKLPDYRSNTNDKLREERRLFYVGLTRARHEVHLIYSGWYETAYRRIENGPSRFVTEVQNSLL